MNVLAGFLLNVSWQLAFIGALALAASRLTSRLPAAHRHLLFALALAVCVALAASHAPRPHSAAAPSLVSGTITASPPAAIVFPASILLPLTAMYLIFVLLRTARLTRALLYTRRLRKSARPRELPEMPSEILAHCLERLGSSRPRILWSAAAPGPLTVGVLRPAIILPVHLYHERSAALWTTVLGHELAHIKRGDFAWNVFWEVTTLPIAFHPAVPWLQQELAATREQACDEVVTDELLDSGSYARALIHVAGNVSFPDRFAHSMGIGSGAPLEDRVMRILNRRPAGKLAKLAGLASATIFVVAAACASAFALTVAADEVNEEQNRANDDAREALLSADPDTVARLPYEARGKRDPFLSPLSTERSNPLGFEVESLALHGIVETPRGFTAMLEGPDRKTYFIKRGESFFNGTLIHIDRDSLTFRVREENPLRPGIGRDVVMPLHREN